MYLLKIKSILSLIFVLLCQQGISQYIPFCQKGKWGFATTAGTITIPCVYEEVDFYSDDSLAKVKKSGKYGYINRKGETVLPLEYDNCIRIYEVYHGEHTIGIKRNPEIHLNYDFDYEEIKNNRYIVSKNELFGIISIRDGNPKELIALKYSTIQFDPNKKIFHCSTSGTTRYFNVDGKSLTEEQVNAMEPVEFSSVGRAEIDYKPEVVKINGKVGVIHNIYNSSYRTKYDTVVPVIYDDITIDQSNDYYFQETAVFGVKLNKKWGIVDGKKNVLLPIKYDSVNFELSNDSRHWAEYERMFVVRQNGQWGILGKKNDKSDSFSTLLPFEYQGVNEIYNSYWLVKKGNRFQVYNIDTYKLINTKTYSSIAKYQYESVDGFELFQVTNKLGQIVFLGENGVEFFID